MIARREFITLLGGAAVTWPVVTRAQQATIPVIGFLNGQSAAAYAHLVAAFHRGLNEVGFVERQNVAIEYRWAEGQSDRLPQMAAELISRRVNVIVAVGGAHVIAKSATQTIPIICTFGGDPTKDGFVASLNRPGGNVTGASVFSTELEAKRFELLHQLVPGDTLVGALIDPGFSDAETQRRQVEAAASILRRRIRVFEVRTEHEIDSAFESLRA